MIKCENCGKTIEENVEIGPSCGSYLYDDISVTNPEVRLKSDESDEDTLDEPVNIDEAFENLPDDTYNDDELERRELEEERRKFGKSSE